MKIKEDQTKYHDKHVSQELKELQPGINVRLEPWTNRGRIPENGNQRR